MSTAAERIIESYHMLKAAEKRKEHLDAQLNGMHNFIDSTPQPVKGALRGTMIFLPIYDILWKRRNSAEELSRSWEKELKAWIGNKSGKYPLTRMSCNVSANILTDIFSPFIWGYDFPVEKDTYIVGFGSTGLFAKKADGDEPLVEIRDEYQPILHLPSGMGLSVISFDSFSDPQPQPLYARWQPHLTDNPRCIGIPQDIVIPSSTDEERRRLFTDTEELTEIGYRGSRFHSTLSVARKTSS